MPPIARLATLAALAFGSFALLAPLAACAQTGGAETARPSIPAVVAIPAGPFIAGSDAAEREAAYQLDEAAYGHSRTREWKWYENETPRHLERLSDYFITRTPITNAQYAAFVQDTGHRVPDVDLATWQGYRLIHPFERTRKFAWSGARPSAGREDHPVVLVSHGDALAYASWLSETSGRKWRLPTEAEWEKAARGTGGQWFPWGDVWHPTRLNSHDRGPFDTLPVGQFRNGASPFGLWDPAGQVFEWTATPGGPGRYIVKGGSWDDKGCGICRPAARHTRPEAIKHILVGFRLVSE